MEKRSERRRYGVVAVAVATFAVSPEAFPAELPVALRCSFFDSATVNDTVIRLGDIASVSGEADGRRIRDVMNLPVGEAAPPGYARFVNTDDVVRYYLSAGKTGMHVELNQVKRISVRTEFREIGVPAFESDLAHYINGTIRWASGDYTLSIVDKKETLKCYKKPYTTSFEGLPSKYPKGNFYCRAIIQQGTKRMRLPVSCFISVCTPVLVASVPMKRGTALNSENCHSEKLDITHFSYLPYTDLKSIRNTIVSRSVNAGTIIHEKLTAQVPLVKRDELVRLIAIQGNIRACIAVKARESGGEGSLIMVENEMTHKLIKAKIVGEGQVLLFNGNEGI
jgi:flagella basal body P-ring formation protein FlgA